MALRFLNSGYFAGSVGIGTDSPGAVLSVRNPTAGTSAFSLQHSTTSSIFDFQTGIANVTGDALVIKDVANSYDYLTLRGGNVGIGATAPTANLHVNSAANTVLKIQAGINSSASLRLINDAIMWDLNTQTNDTFAIYNQTSGTQPFSILPGGNVGIGATVPTEKLEITGNVILDASNARLKIKGGVAGTNSGIDWTFNSDTTSYAKLELDYDTRASTGLLIDSGYPMTLDYSSSRFAIQYNGAEQMRVNTSGNVGIGTTSPGAKLEVAGGSTGIRLSNVGDSGAYDSVEMTYNGYNSGTPEMKFRPTQTPGSGIVNSYFRFINSNGSSTTANNNANVTIDGSVGIGTTSPGANLDVKKGSEGLYFAAGGDTGNARSLQFTSSANGGSNGAMHTIDAISGNGLIAFATAGAEKMRIQSNGNVGIGTTSPAVPLDVEGKIRSTNDNSGSYLEMFNDGDVSGNSFIKSTSGELIIESAADITFSPNSTEKLRITSTGDIELASSSRIVLDDQPTASTASGSGTIVKWSVSAATTVGLMYILKFDGTWTATDADSEVKSTGMAAIALGTNANLGMLLQGFFYKSAHGFTIGLPLYISNTAGALTTTRPTGTNDYVRVVGYATSANYIYFDPDKTWVQVA